MATGCHPSSIDTISERLNIHPKAASRKVAMAEQSLTAMLAAAPGSTANRRVAAVGARLAIIGAMLADPESFDRWLDNLITDAKRPASRRRPPSSASASMSSLRR